MSKANGKQKAKKKKTWDEIAAGIRAESRAENARDGELFTLIAQEFSEIDNMRHRDALAREIGAELVAPPIPRANCLWQMVGAVSRKLKESFAGGVTDHPKVRKLIEADKELERAIEAVRKSALPQRVSDRLAKRLQNASDSVEGSNIAVSMSVAFLMGLMTDKLGPDPSDTFSKYNISPNLF